MDESRRWWRALVRGLPLHFGKLPLASWWRMDWKGARAEQEWLGGKRWMVEIEGEGLEVCRAGNIVRIGSEGEGGVE